MTSFIFATSNVGDGRLVLQKAVGCLALRREHHHGRESSTSHLV